jgi:hypothetical protein
MNIASREYKLLVSHESFTRPDEARQSVWEQIEEAVQPLPGIETTGDLDEEETRRIVFLDTPEQTLRRNGLVLRQRADDHALEYTLKCRSEDRLFAAGTDVRAATGEGGELKLEEDIAPPFRSRVSYSATIKIDEDSTLAGHQTPKKLRAAAELFPLLGTLRRDGRRCDPETDLEVVNGITVDESVWKGAHLVFERDGEAHTDKATVALILWTRGLPRRPALAELSFRFKDIDESFGRHLAEAARLVYQQFGQLDCSRPDGLTKTEYIYRDGVWD